MKWVTLMLYNKCVTFYNADNEKKSEISIDEITFFGDFLIYL